MGALGNAIGGFLGQGLQGLGQQQMLQQQMAYGNYSAATTASSAYVVEYNGYGGHQEAVAPKVDTALDWLNRRVNEMRVNL